MPDLTLDYDPTSPNFGDLKLSNNDLTLTSGAEEILQTVIQQLKMFFGEWFLNNTEGVPYYQQILIKNPDQPTIDALLSDKIKSVPGVLVLQQYSFAPDFVKRILNVSFRAQTTQGPVSYSGNIGG